MAVRLYAERENGKLFIISFDVERDAAMAKMTVEEYIDGIKNLILASQKYINQMKVRRINIYD